MGAGAGAQKITTDVTGNDTEEWLPVWLRVE